MTDNTENRIRLAEAMGWKRVRLGTEYAWKRPDGRIVGIFRPDTDANDDYAVLEWMRNRVMDNQDYTSEEWDQWCDFVRRMHDVSGDVPGYYSPQTAYRIGDYARAALKVLDGEALQEGE